MTARHRHAGIYVRISDDKAEDAAGVGRQERDCRELAARHGWDVAEVYVENDTSAFKRRTVRLPDGSSAQRVVRPAFRRLLDDLASGAVDAVVGYDLDRIARDPRDLEDLIDTVESRKVPTRAVTGSLDLSTDAGITMARVMVAIANKSSRDSARRIARKHVELAETGRVGGGGIRSFGYERDGMTINKTEAAVVRKLAKRILAGHSLRECARWLTASGVPTVQGGAWNARSVHSVVSKARNAGLREHKGEIVGAAVWPPILERDTWERVRLTLETRASGSTNSLRHWLTGVLLCAKCDRPLVGRQMGARGDSYGCVSMRGGCGKIAIDGTRTERFVEKLILGYLSRPDVLAVVRDARSDKAAARARLDAQADQGQLKELAEMWAARSITMKEYMAARKVIEERLATSRGIVRAALPGAVRELLAGDAEKVWATFGAARRREAAATVFEQGIRVRPSTQLGFRGYDSARLDPVGWQ